MRTFQELNVWQKARVLVKKMYTLTSEFPEEEKFVLISQPRRAMVSIPSNIAEGYGGNAPKGFQRFLEIALGSLYEVQTQSVLASGLGYISKNKYDTISEDIIGLSKKLNTFINKIVTN